MNKYFLSSLFLTLLVILGGCSVDNNEVIPDISPNISENQDIIVDSSNIDIKESTDEVDIDDKTNEVPEDSVKSEDTSVVVTTIIKRNDKGLIQECPDTLIENRMPMIVNDPLEKQPIRQYYILDGQRYELNEFDSSWMGENCGIIKPMPVY